MVEFLIIVLILLALVIMGLLWVIIQQSKGLQVSIPQEALKLLVEHQGIAIQALKELAKLTPTTLDDQILGGAFPESPKSVASNAVVG